MDIEALRVFKQCHDFAKERIKEIQGENPSEKEQGYLDALNDVSLGIQDAIDFEENR